MSRYNLFEKLRHAKKMHLIRGRIHHCSIFFTRKCNLSCQYCQAMKNVGVDISLDKWMQIMDKLYAMGVKIIAITGGEPSLRKDLADLVGYMSSKGLIVALFSNLCNLTEYQLSEFGKSGLDFITGSVDSIDGAQKSLNSSIDLLKQSGNFGIIPSIQTVINNDNIADIPTIACKATMEKIYFYCDIIQQLGGFHSTANHEAKALDINEINKLFLWLKNEKKKNRYIMPTFDYLKNGKYLGENWKCSCKKDFWLTINNDGRLMICQEYETPLHFMDMQDFPNQSWWNVKEKIVSNCGGCFYNCYFTLSRIRGFRLLNEFFRSVPAYSIFNHIIWK